MKEYDLFFPLYYHDGRKIQPSRFQDLQAQILKQFGGLTFFPQSNEGVWTMAGITYRDAIVIYHVITSDVQGARKCLSALKESLKEEFQQVETL